MADQLSREQFDEIEKALESGNKIEAIKLYRKFSGLGLKESKEFVEEHIRGLVERNPKKYEHLVSKGGRGCSSAAVFLVGLSIGIFYLIM